MTQSRPAAWWLLLSFAVLAALDGWTTMAPAVPPAAGRSTENEPPDGVRLIPDGRATKRLEAARDLMEQNDWSEATRILQTLLDMKEDAFIRVPRRADNGELAARWTSV